MKRLTSLIACSVVLALLSPATAAPLRLADEIERRNPELATLAARIDQARAEVGPAGSWEDPRFSSEVMDAPTLGGARVTVTQMVPLLGQPGLMAEMARLEVAMREAEWADRRLMLTADAAQAILDLAYVRRATAILATSRDLTERMARVSEAKYGVGKGMQSDVLRAHVAKTRLLEPSIAFEARRTSSLASLAAIAPGLAPPAAPLASVARLAPLEQWWAEAEQASPMLRMRRLAVEHAQAAQELARRERVPDVEVGLQAGRTMPGDMPYVGAMASVGLPVWWQSKQQARVEAATQALSAQQQALESARRQLRARLEATHAQARAAEAQLKLYQGGLLIQARQAFQAALAGYQVNQGDFLMVLDAQMALNDVQMSEAMALAERLKMQAMLEALAGREPLGEVLK